MKTGATGKFPGGKLDETDEGELTIAVAYDQVNNLLHIRFGKPVAWLALGPEEAIGLANALLEKAQRGRQ